MFMRTFTLLNLNVINANRNRPMKLSMVDDK